MTTHRPTDDLDNHHEHAHLDGGRCLDGTGRTWDEHAARTSIEQLRARLLSSPTMVLPPDPVARRLDRLALSLILLTVAEVCSAIAAVLHYVGSL